MTNSCPRFTRYLIHAPLRFPGWYRLSFRFPMIPSSPCSRTARLLEDCPNARSWASVAKDHSAQFVAETLGFLWVGSVAEKLGKLEKLLLLALLSFDPVLDEFHQHPVGAKPPGFRHAANLRCHVYRKTDALTYCFVYRPHNTSMHHNGAIVHIANSSLVCRWEVGPCRRLA